MGEVWNKKFENRDVNFPNEIAKSYCDQLYEVTNKLVIAKVEKYSATLDSLDLSSALADLATSSLFKGSKAEELLGEVSGDDKFTYELYITGINTPNYKYRFCFIENGIYPYPVKIIMDTDIATELNEKTRIKCDNEEEFKAYLIKILKSKKLYDVISGLMTINSKIDKK